jgi:hypothetical protein
MATIPSLFAPNGGNPAELTDFDSVYLRSLYSSAADASAAKNLVDVQRFAQKASRKAQAAKP